MRAQIKRTILQLSPTQFIISCYTVAVVLSTLSLKLPLSLKPDVELSWMNSLFIATSAISVTGLTSVNVAETFSVFGTFMIMIMLQLGGIGIMTLGTFLWLILGKNISLSYRRLIAIDQNRNTLSGLVKLMKLVFTLAILIEAVGFVIFTIYFKLAGYYDTWLSSAYYGLFHALSSYTNAGFDIFIDNSISQFSTDYFVQTITIVLLVLGAIGFPVLIEVTEYLFGKHKNFRFSLYSKLTSSMFFLLLFLGMIGIWIFENNLYFLNLPWHEQLFYSLFNSVTTRSGGLSTMDVSEFGPATQFLLSILMFIGASPSSVGGGIRTTTFAVVVLALAFFAIGKTEVHIMKRTIKQEDILKAFVVFSFAVISVMISIMILSVLEVQFTLMQIIFEVCSAFGTSGLSMGITEGLSVPSKLIIIILMFAGRIGILTFLFMFKQDRRKGTVHYPKEDIIIG